MRKTKLAIIGAIILGLAGAGYGGWVFYGNYSRNAELKRNISVDITKLDSLPEDFKKIGNVSKGKYDFSNPADVKRAENDFAKMDAMLAAMPKT